jgi:mRNA interferase MazF
MSVKYQIVEAMFPFIDQLNAKNRPVLIISEPLSKYNTVVCAYITTKVPSILLETDLVIEPNLENGLTSRSVIRFHKLNTLEKSAIDEYTIGSLPEDLSETVLNKIYTVFERTKKQ